MLEAGECLLERLVTDRPEVGDIMSTLDACENDEDEDEDSSDHEERGEAGTAAGS